MEMVSLHPILRSALTGFFSAFLLAIPVGPVNLTIINEGARRGRKWAVLISLGATSMEIIYCFIAFTGLASFLLTGAYVKAGMELFSFVFMLVLGLKFLLAKSVSAPVELGETAHKIEARIGARLNPSSAFMTGFVRVLANPGVMVGWFFIAAYFMSRDWVTPDWQGKIACVAGVGLGTVAWFMVLSCQSSKGYGKFSEKTLLRIEHWSGIGLLLLALLHGSWIVRQMVEHHREMKADPPALHQQ
jgi:threonine/homoserine/homoserine lactone efflux protein